MKHFQKHSLGYMEPRLIHRFGISRSPTQRPDEGNEQKKLEDKKNKLIERIGAIRDKCGDDEVKKREEWNNYMNKFKEEANTEHDFKRYELWIERREEQMKLFDRRKKIAEMMNTIINETAPENKSGWEKYLDEFNKKCDELKDKLEKSKHPSTTAKKIKKLLDDYEHKVETKLVRMRTDNHKEEIKSLKEEDVELNKAIGELRKKDEDLADRIEALAAKNERELAEAVAKLAAADTKMANNIADLAERDKELASDIADLAERDKELASDIAKLVQTDENLAKQIVDLDKKHEKIKEEVEINRMRIDSEQLRDLELEELKLARELKSATDKMANVGEVEKQEPGEIETRKAESDIEDAANLEQLETQIARASKETNPEIPEDKKNVARTPSVRKTVGTFDAKFAEEIPEKELNALKEEQRLNAFEKDISRQLNQAFGGRLSVIRSDNQFVVNYENKTVGGFICNLEDMTFNIQVEGMDEKDTIKATSNAEAVGRIVKMLRENADGWRE